MQRALSLLLPLILLVAAVQPQPYVYLQVYPSGYVKATYRIRVTALAAESLYLIGSPDLITAYYANGTPLPYVVQNGSIILEPPNNGTAEVRYYTESIVSKNALGWYLNFTTPYPVTVQLPYNSSLFYISGVPSSISVVNGSIVLSLSPGSWEIGYILAPPVQAPAKSPVEYYYLIAGAAVAGAVVAYLLFRALQRHRGEEPETLRDIDRQIIEYLRKRGGSAKESEIRQALVLPKTTAWRAIKRLEREGKVRVTRIGRENLVELLD